MKRYNDVTTAKVIGAIAVLVIVLFGAIAAGYGYVMNILQLVHATGISGLVVARAIGIFVAPLGIILGFV